MRSVMMGLVLFIAASAWGQPRLRLETGIGHTKDVSTAAFSSDGNLIVTGAADSTARVWETKTGRLLRSLVGHTGNILTAKFSPDSKQIVTASTDKTVRVWGLVSGKLVSQFSCLPALATCASFAPDGKTILCGVSDGSARMVNVRNGLEERRFQVGTGSVFSAVMSADGKTFATGGLDRVARIWDARTGALLHRLTGHQDAILRIAISADRKFVLTGSADNSARLWDCSSEEEILNIPTNGELVYGVEISTDGSKLAVGDAAGVLRLLDAHTGNQLALTTLGGLISSAAFSPDGTYVLTSNSNGYARLSTIRNLSAIVRYGSAGFMSSASFTPDGVGLVTAGRDRVVRLWSLDSGQLIQTYSGHGGSIESAVVSADGAWVLTGSQDGDVRLFDALTGRELRKFSGHNRVLDAVFSVDLKAILSSGADGTFRLWDIQSGKELRSYIGPSKVWVMSVSFSPTGAAILISSHDGTARIYERSTGTELLKVDDKSTMEYASFDASGRIIVTACRDGFVSSWDASSGTKLASYVGHSKTVNMVSCSYDNRLVLTGSDDGTARLWDFQSGKEIRRLEGHAGAVRCAKFNPSLSTVVTASDDCSAKLWDTATGKELCSLISFYDGSWAVVDPEGRYDSSDGGQNPNLYWVYEDPAKGILDTVGVDQIGSYFYTPGLLAKCMKREKLPQVENLDKLPIFPKVDNLTIDKSKATFTLTDRGGGIGQVKAFVDGQLVKTIQGKSGKNTLDLEAEGQDIQIVAYNGKNNLASPRSTTTSPPPLSVTTPTRYVAVIAGIETYAGPGLKPLNYAADDAVAIARSVLACAKGLKITPDIYVLSSAPEAQDLKKEGITVLPATKAAFRTLFTKTLPEQVGKWRDSDLMFLYFSGHGGSYKEGNLSHYAYYTEDARDADLSIKRDEWAVTDVELVEWLAKFPGGKRAMILDTCAAGAATELLAQAKDDADRKRAILETNRNTGMAVLFGCADTAVSWEINGHGLLTNSILRALSTEDLGEGLKDAIRVNTLFARVEAVTRDEAERLGLKQEPWKTGQRQNFPIGFLDDAGRKAIPYQSPVPLFGKPSLINSATGLDDLDLMAQLGDALRRSSQPKSGEPLPLRYVPDSPAAVQIQGAYTISGDRVTVIMNLLEKGKAPVPLKVEATKQDLVDAAVSAIITWARGKAK